MVVRVARTTVLTLALALLCAPAAHAGWPLTSSAPVALGYGQPWDQGDSVHRGIDLGCEPEARVVAPSDATVAFAGQVPAGAAGAGTVWAVSLDLPGDERITLMPLAGVVVDAGRELREGDAVGLVAADGDPSYPQTHLHVSLRRNGAYLDPALRLEPPVAPHPETDGRDGDSADAVTPSPRVVSVPAAGRPAAPAGASTGRQVTPQPHAGTGAAAAPRVQAETPALPESLAQPDRAPAGSAASIAGSRSDAAERAVRALDIARRLATRASEPSVEADAPSAGLARIAARSASWVGSALLAAAFGAGLLWPIWRREGSESPGGVRPVGDDVAAAVGRC